MLNNLKPTGILNGKTYQNLFEKIMQLKTDLEKNGYNVFFFIKTKNNPFNLGKYRRSI